MPVMNSRLRIFEEAHPDRPLLSTMDRGEMARELEKIGVAFEQWEASKPVAPVSSRLTPAERGFRSVDVVSIAPDHPQREEMRAKFLDEHFHKEDEVRFFVAGSGLFTLHVDDRVYEVLCTQGDLIAVPDSTTHWFDMGPEPSFVAIRFFTQPDGWVGHFTGTDIAQRFPRFGG